MNTIVILAGGVGTRMGKSVPKQYIVYNDKPVLQYTLESALLSKKADRIAVVCAAEWIDYINELKSESVRVDDIIMGGTDRFHSMFNALKQYYATGNQCSDVILFHDACRPLVSSYMFDRAFENVEPGVGVLTCDPCYDSMYQVDGEFVIDGVDRDILVKGQTPEAAYLQDYMYSFLVGEKEEKFNLAASDLMLNAGKKVKKVPGESTNFKLTVDSDLELFKAYLNR